MRVNKYFFIYFLIKIFYMFFAWFIYSKFTVLGDTVRYVNSSINFTKEIFYKSTDMMEFFGGIFGFIFNYSILSNLPFMILSFYGIYYSISRLKVTKRDLFYIFLLLSFPSFGVWTSIVSKEAVGVFFMGIILGYIIDLYYNINRKIKLIEYFAFYLVFVFKPQYLVAIVLIIFFIKFFRYFRFNANIKLFWFVFYIICVIIGFYLLRDFINHFQYIIPNNFRLDAGSTRKNTIWVNDYDIFYNMFYGMIIGWWGPTISEILIKPMQSIVFCESFIIFMFFLYLVCFFIKDNIKTKKVNIFLFILFNIPLFWLLFAQYPFGVFNPGSALRYRENFYAFLVIWFYFIYKEYKIWRICV